MSFASLGLSEALVGAVEAAGYTQPTPVQQRAIPAVLQNRDLMVAAQTGTGKTGGFALPILEKLFPNGQPDRQPRHRARQPRVLVLTPTRELAAQVHDSFKLYARDLDFVSTCIFGGVGMNPQIQAISKGVDVLVACPGRLLDLVGQNAVDLSAVEILVLDEADRMLDMGFVHDVKKVLARLPAERQNLLFSATFSPDIVALANKLLRDPERIEVTPPNTTVERIEQRVFRIQASHKRALLAHLITQGAWEQVLVFTRTKHGANRLAEHLDKNGLSALAIHGNKSQNARTKALAEFKANKVRILVATDIAARGLDIDQLPHVVNFELPNVEEDYVHRIGRTGRAGRSGEAISLVAPDEEKLLRNIERITKQKIEDGDSLGFDPSTIEIERPEVRPPRPPRQPRPEQKAKPERRNTGEQDSSKRGPRSDNHRKPQNRGPRSPQPSYNSIPPLPADRAPDEFRDDDIDNFGNRVDYVPVQAKPQGRNRRPQGQNNQHAARQGAGTNGGHNNPRRNGAANPKPRHAAPGNNENRTRGPRGPRPTRDNTGRSDNLREPVVQPRERQPVIIHKGERLPTAAQLDDLPRRPRSEKPALLMRNREPEV